jgi:predicted ATP-grasp superfamily ATP-dependent carboligase
MMRPWVDVGSVGTTVLNRLERYLKAAELAKLAEPGRFFDFTRYRPMLRYANGERQVTIPNTFINYSQAEGLPDLLFAHLLEPHSLGEEYIESVLELFKEVGVKRYLLVGGMYDVVPHTRPLRISGSLRIPALDEGLAERFRVKKSTYEGPTSILYMISRKAQEIGLETGNLTVHLPQYVQLEEDLSGAAAVLAVLSELYGLPQELQAREKAARQYVELGKTVARNPELGALVQRLESMYDARVEEEREPEDSPPLSPQVERFLLDIDERFSSN